MKSARILVAVIAVAGSASVARAEMTSSQSPAQTGLLASPGAWQSFMWGWLLHSAPSYDNVLFAHPVPFSGVQSRSISSTVYGRFRGAGAVCNQVVTLDYLGDSYWAGRNICDENPSNSAAPSREFRFTDANQTYLPPSGYAYSWVTVSGALRLASIGMWQF
jgi:hypothetical protein